MAVVPIARGLFLCSHVETDEATTNLSLLDCFRSIRIDGPLPAGHVFYAVAHLANGVGVLPTRIEVARLDTLEPVYMATVPVSYPNRLQEVRFKLRTEQCLFAVEGGYKVSLFVGGEEVTHTDVFVRLQPRGTP